MKRLLYLLFIGFAFVFTACEKEEGSLWDDGEDIETSPTIGEIKFFYYYNELDKAYIYIDDYIHEMNFYYYDDKLDKAYVKTENFIYEINFYYYGGKLDVAYIK